MPIILTSWWWLSAISSTNRSSLEIQTWRSPRTSAHPLSKKSPLKDLSSSWILNLIISALNEAEAIEEDRVLEDIEELKEEAHEGEGSEL
ncbi:hypothetical protein L596_019543 [Steinernema carpocapsae]|uniref:Uncharacterized protein n=1 Tax=Steinernema carpocapsae TaxID=34508 RepID=A0A4U5MQU2_STECR|nr:hypothetical protein L596_019543 [Steinernema carpocapsae]